MAESDFIYIHLDNVSNSVLTKGVSYSDYQVIIQQPIPNLLLLNAPKEIGEYDSHTGFRIIRGTKKVEEFLSSEKYPIYLKKLGKWIDFHSIDLLHELTPIEISELLYVAHAYTTLHSPFYYKLQNNFIVLSMPNDFAKVYYRDIAIFYQFFAREITNRVKECVKEKRLLFKKPKAVEDIPIELIQELIPLLREGVALSFSKVTSRDKVSEIEIYLVEDRLRNLDLQMKKSELMSIIQYDHQTQEWTIKEVQQLIPSL